MALKAPSTFVLDGFSLIAGKKDVITTV